jgi:3-oxoacyl-[acyl-carrier-protein] synthase-3
MTQAPINGAALALLGLGAALPASRNVRETARAAGADDTTYRGWEKACQAGPDDHPSTLGAQALEQALAAAQVPAAELSLLLYTGSSRDYVPSWSVSSEIMKLTGATTECLGMDMTSGCLATLVALEFARSWLLTRGGGYAAVVAAERWSHTVDYRDPTSQPLWPYGDSGGALVVSLGRETRGPVLGHFPGAEFRSGAQYNGGVFIPYGGTRQPVAPPGANPLARRMASRPGKEITASYRKGYGDSAAALLSRFAAQPATLVCNQLSPNIVAMLGELFGLKENAIATGDAYGHLGGVDIIVGLRRVLESDHPRFPILVAASTAYGWGTGLVTAP